MTQIELQEFQLDVEGSGLIRAVVETLRRAGYFQFYSAFGDGNLSFSKIAIAAESLPQPLNSYVQLFLLGGGLPVAAFEEHFGEAAKWLLLKAKILELDGEKISSGKTRLIRLRGFDYFVEYDSSPEVYFGDDSIALTVFQEAPLMGVALDLCSGPGIQALVAATRCQKVHAVEINARAAIFARINAAINGVDERVHVHNSSFEDFFSRNKGTFDLILCNPPLLPIPPGISYPFVGAGGENALEITNRIIELGAKTLSETGVIQFIGTGLGEANPQVLHFAEELETLATTSKLTCTITILSMQRLCVGSALYDGIVATSAYSNKMTTDQIEPVFSRHFKSLGADALFLFFCSMRKGASAAHTRIDMTSHFYGDWFV